MTLPPTTADQPDRPVTGTTNLFVGCPNCGRPMRPDVIETYAADGGALVTRRAGWCPDCDIYMSGDQCAR